MNIGEKNENQPGSEKKYESLQKKKTVYSLRIAKPWHYDTPSPSPTLYEYPCFYLIILSSFNFNLQPLN